MSDGGTTTVFIQGCLDRLRGGDGTALALLITRAYHRLGVLSQRMFKDYQRLRPYADPDDVLQGAAERLQRALEACPPPTVAEFFRLAAALMRRELIDLTRRYFGPHGDGANQVALAAGSASTTGGEAAPDPSQSTHDPSRLAMWREFHEAVELLDEPLRDVFNLLYYHEVTQEEAAETLAVSVATVRRRWVEARLRLQQALRNDLPGS